MQEPLLLKIQNIIIEVHTMLQLKCNALVSVKYDALTDVFIFDFYLKSYDIMYHTIMKDAYKIVKNGVSSQFIVFDVFNEYYNFVNTLFFKDYKSFS